jgi:hypothetical protein
MEATANVENEETLTADFLLPIGQTINKVIFYSEAEQKGFAMMIKKPLKVEDPYEVSAAVNRDADSTSDPLILPDAAPLGKFLAAKGTLLADADGDHFPAIATQDQAPRKISAKWKFIEDDEINIARFPLAEFAWTGQSDPNLDGYDEVANWKFAHIRQGPCPGSDTSKQFVPICMTGTDGWTDGPIPPPQTTAHYFVSNFGAIGWAWQRFR